MPRTLLLSGLLVASLALSSGTEAKPLESAGDPGDVEFTASTDSQRAVLFVGVMSPQTGMNRSMTLYGDGRLVIAQLGPSRQVIKEKALQLPTDESHELLEIAVNHRLAEYDEADIRARELRGKTTPGSEGALDATTTIARISLDSYSRDGHATENLEKEIQVYGLKQAALSFPDITEYQGLKALQDRLYNYWSSVGWPLW